jgi:hypothetical protein
LKKVILAFLIAVVVVGTGVVFTINNTSADQASTAKVIVYYFHGTFRCPTCYNMEKYSKEAIETNFKDALSSGTLEFKVVNVEEKGNEHYANDYKLYTKSLILSLLKDGKEIRHKNLEKIWENAHNRQKFIEYVTEELNGFMKDAR